MSSAFWSEVPSYRPSRCWEIFCVPKSFAGLFGAAPSVALATLGIAVYQHGADYGASQTQAMIAGAIALAVYSVAVCHLLVRAKLSAVTATLPSLIVWLIVAFGLLIFAGGQT
ncbi:hypothetical protein ACVWVY_000432 [Bradyrhizobium sp. URHC0002]